MIFRPNFSGKSALKMELDIEGDPTLVRIDGEIICGKCMKEMEQKSPNIWECPLCSASFKETQDPN